MSNSITIYNFKGGVGKTTTAINLGISWSKSFKVLLIDFDPQCNLTNSLCPEGVNRKYSIFSLLRNVLHDHEVESRPVEITPYLHLIPGDFQMTQMESNNQFISFGSTIIFKFLNRIKRDYDFVIMDCPTNFGILVRSVIKSSGNILIPALADNFSITGVQKLMTYLASAENANLNILGVFFNMFNSKTLLNQAKFDEAKEKFGNIILESSISRSIKVGEANDAGKSILDHSPENTAAQDFERLSDELLAKFDSQQINDDFIIPELLDRIVPKAF